LARGEAEEASGGVARLVVEEALAGGRLDRVLAEGLGISRARVRHLLEVGRILSAGRSVPLAEKGRPVEAGRVFEVSGPLEATAEVPVARPDLDPRVVADGPGWLVVDKPAGRPVHPLRPDEDETVLNAVVARHPEILGVGEGGLRSGVVHRLDVDTSGALVMATEEMCWKRLRGAFSEHRVEKRYQALVVGRFEADRFVDLWLDVVQHSPARVAVVEPGRGRRCRQRVMPRRSFEGATLVEVALETGFLHQIRASLAHLGHPVVGDAIYGDAEEAGSRSTAAPRQLLHASRIAVDEIVAEVPLPADFEAVLSRLSEPGAG